MQHQPSCHSWSFPRTSSRTAAAYCRYSWPPLALILWSPSPPSVHSLHAHTRATTNAKSWASPSVTLLPFLEVGPVRQQAGPVVPPGAPPPDPPSQYLHLHRQLVHQKPEYVLEWRPGEQHCGWSGLECAWFLLLLAKASKLTFCRLMSRPPYVCTRPTYAVVFLVILGENYGRPLDIRSGITSHCASYFW